MDILNYEAEEKLWELFSLDKDEYARSQLIQKNMPLAKYLASILYKRRIDDDVSFDDYLQYANVGLIEAVDNFDCSRDVSFSSFASYRIKGAILNGISTFTEKREQIALKKRLNKERVDSLMTENENTFAEMVEITLGLAISFILSDTNMIQLDEENACDDLYQQHNVSQLKRELRDLIQMLSESEKIVISKHYFEHEKFTDIAESLNITKGRVSQLHKNAIKKLRSYSSKNQFDDIL